MKAEPRMTACATYRFWKHALLWLGVLLVLMARVPLLWQAGEFVAEDGWVFFAGAFNAPWFESIFTPFAGYFRFDARIIAELVSALPWTWQPTAFGLIGLGINALMLSLFYAPGFRPLLASDAVRLGVVALLALAPNAENLGLLTGQHWYLSFALGLWLVMDPPSGRMSRIALVGASSLFVWSAPSTLVLAPLFAYRGFTATDPFTKTWSGLLVVQWLFCAMAILVFRGTEGSRSAAFATGDLFAAGEHLMVRGWLAAGFWGRGVAEWLATISPGLVDVLGGGMLCGLVWLFRRGRNGQSTGLLLILLAAVLMTLFSLTRTLYIGELAELDLPRHVRYLTAPTLLLIVGGWICLMRAVAPVRRRYLWGVAGVQLIALIGGLSSSAHWARPPGEFRLHDYGGHIDDFEQNFIRKGKAGSLYVPNDVPYWGLVLESAGGKLVPPTVGVVASLNAVEKNDGSYESWLGSFRSIESVGGPLSVEIEHSDWGRLTYTGTEQGRVWFLDEAGRQWFTSELLYPDAWIIDGLEMTLISPRGT